MKPPHSPTDEARRLEVLRQYDLLDTLPEPALDDLTALVAQICEVPISLISIIDEKRQWFKSKVGLSPSETPRNISFCGHTILQRDLVIVPDATKDERFADNPLVTGDLHMRFYAGAPLVTADGHALGTLCVIDREPRQLTPLQQEALRVLSRQAMAQLELRRQTRKLAKSERFLRAIFDSEPECVKLLGPDGSLRMMNRAGLDMIEADTFGEVGGHCVYSLVVPEHRAKFQELTERVFRGESGTADFQIVGLKGASRWLETHAAPLRDERGEVTALLSVTRDITEQKRAEEALRESEGRLRRMFESPMIGTLFWDATGRISDANDAFLKIVGYSRDDLAAGRLDWAAMTPPEYSELDERALAEIAATGRCMPFEKEYIRKDGSRVPVLVGGAPLEGKKECGVSFVLDVTERKLAAAALDSKSATLAAVTKSLAAYVERGDWKEAMGCLLRHALDQTQSEYGFIGVVVDTTLRVLAHEGIVWDKVINRDFYEQALRNYEKCGYLEFTDFNNLFGRAITTGKVVIANMPESDPRSKGRPSGHPPMHSFLGVPIFVGQHVQGLIALANRPGGYSEEEQHHIETLVQHAGGLCTSYRQREANLALEQERQRAEQSLRDSNERFRQLAENINEVFWITNPAKDQMLYISPVYEKIWGRTCESLYAAPQTWVDAIFPEDRARVGHAAITKQTRGDYDETYRIQRPDGTVRWIHDRAFPIRNAAGEVHRIVGTAEDITEQRQLEEQFRQSQKMEAIGQLAGGVAHDFNNILAAIIMQADLAATVTNAPKATIEYLDDIKAATERAANLTRQLLAFSRRQVMQPRQLDLNEIVASLTKMLQRILGEDVRLQLNLHPRSLLTRADSGMLDQVLLNLVVNARDAMPAGGRLTIETGEKKFTKEEAALIPDASPGRHVCLRVIDTGSGIAPDHLSRIFEPFFTTKEPGKGTGLGLATLFGIVKQHGGSVAVESEVGKGTTFQIFLPAVESAAKLPDEAIVKSKPRGGTETILLVEDEPSVRMLTRIILERFGYQVLEAADGVEGERIWEKHQDSIRLLFTDIVMPEGISGRELAARLQSRNPKLRVVFTSGYSADIAGRELSLHEGQNFIQKPSSPHQVLETVRKCLDS